MNVSRGPPRLKLSNPCAPTGLFSAVKDRVAPLDEVTAPVLEVTTMLRYLVRDN